ncbi:AAA family ATPase [Agrococcus sp. SCSIO52902]|uniref:AAA family ATPase n=1 Tax=Agrococcus sp. SCSIO52902 TaxID=2933290 RepID=UPI001FF50884|nr:AAA family ATPase [Agrococcus sp. SCSIO52902]UOW01154.1 ATP-binding protein [Agrococcus sp. SCSIO52902]
MPAASGCATLIVLAGLPGVGKSAVAASTAAALGCTVVSVDPLEAAMWRAGVPRDAATGLAAYVVAEAVAEAQLRLGGAVVVDAVNDHPAAREQWRALAARTGALLLFAEVLLEDRAEHRRRLEQRVRDLDGFPEPTWAEVESRRAAFDEWADDRLRLDASLPVGRLTSTIAQELAPAR